MAASSEFPGDGENETASRRKTALATGIALVIALGLLLLASFILPPGRSQANESVTGIMNSSNMTKPCNPVRTP
jgi:hypothetical protein